MKIIKEQMFNPPDSLYSKFQLQSLPLASAAYDLNLNFPKSGMNFLNKLTYFE